MKIALTGHTSGLGKGLYEQLGALGHEVYGFSTSTGFDINTEAHQHKILGECVECDLFINNAYGWIEPNVPSVKQYAKQSKLDRGETPADLGQVKLFEMFYDAWKGMPNKHIINISSDISHTNLQGSPELKVYWFAKRLLNEKSENKANVSVLKLGTFKSKFSAKLPEFLPKAETKYYVDYVLAVIENIKDFYIADMLLSMPAEGKYAFDNKKDPKKLENFLDFYPKDNVQYKNICTLNYEDVEESKLDNLLQFIWKYRFALWPKWVTLKGTENND